MSFDGPTASTLDIVDVSFQAPRRSSQRRAPARATLASTVDGDLLPEAPSQASTSTIEPMLASLQAYSIDSDADEFRIWLERTGTAAILDLVAKAFARHMGTIGLKVVLETEPEDPNAQRAIVLAPVPLQVEDALDKLFLFTSSPWWLSVVRATRNVIVVDIQPV
jgi:hypothetical protein